LAEKVDRYVLITGASQGLGALLAAEFWAAGFSLILTARDASRLQGVTQRLGAVDGQRITSVAVDLAKPNSVNDLMGRLDNEIPALHVLINNAAVQGPIGPLSENRWEEWLETVQVNLLAPVRLCKAVAPWMVRRSGGSIINLSGGGATSPRMNFSAYATSKAALVRFSETLAEELRPYSVRVNCIAPGAMSTQMLDKVIEAGPLAAGENEHRRARNVREESRASIQRAVKLCLFLASDLANDITGKLISAVWDPWESLPEYLDDLTGSDIYTLRRIVPKDRGKAWGNDQ